ncbi:hypothetical protein KUCAC02_031632, partial [Chaenocephalus aceratus]
MLSGSCVVLTLRIRALLLCRNKALCRMLKGRSPRTQSSNIKTTSLSFPRARFIARRPDDKLSAVQTYWNHRIKGSCHHSHSSRRGLADRRQRRSMSPPFGRRLGECCREENEEAWDVAVSECFLEETRLTVSECFLEETRLPRYGQMDNIQSPCGHIGAQVIGSPLLSGMRHGGASVCTPPHVGQAALRRVGEGVRLVSQEAAACGDDSRDDHTPQKSETQLSNNIARDPKQSTSRSYLNGRVHDVGRKTRT